MNHSKESKCDKDVEWICVGEGKVYLNLPPSVCELKAISSIFIFRFELKINGWHRDA